MLVGACALHAEGRRAGAHDLFDAHLPLLRYERQPGVGLAARKSVLRKRGVLSSDAQRKPRGSLSAEARAEVDFPDRPAGAGARGDAGRGLSRTALTIGRLPAFIRNALPRGEVGGARRQKTLI